MKQTKACVLCETEGNGSRICQADGRKQGKSKGGLRQTSPWKVRMRDYLLTLLAMLEAARYTEDVVQATKVSAI